MRGTTVLILIGIIGAILNWQDVVGLFEPGPVASDLSGGADVVLYTTKQCGYCAKARRHLDRRGIPYVDQDINVSQAAYRQFKKLGGRGMPVIVVGSEVMHGFGAQRLDRMLAGLARGQ